MWDRFFSKYLSPDSAAPGSGELLSEDDEEDDEEDEEDEVEEENVSVRD